ncbi:unnamed protein product [Paramecium sonneborni]|uniref:Uncharacterized protein n=1 Tax=Paramecium sonneborni TaxID=65129 RepID=A0A8S1RT16_9CILI|nr:unnamed protein product [Paramecium sonneborni]
MQKNLVVKILEITTECQFRYQNKRNQHNTNSGQKQFNCFRKTIIQGRKENLPKIPSFDNLQPRTFHKQDFDLLHIFYEYHQQQKSNKNSLLKEQQQLSNIQLSLSSLSFRNNIQSKDKIQQFISQLNEITELNKKDLYLRMYNQINCIFKKQDRIIILKLNFTKNKLCQCTNEIGL